VPRPAVPGHRTPQLQVTSERQARARTHSIGSQVPLGLREDEAERELASGKWQPAPASPNFARNGSGFCGPCMQVVDLHCCSSKPLLHLAVYLPAAPLLAHPRRRVSTTCRSRGDPWDSRSVQFHTLVQHIGQASCHAMKRNRMKRSVTLLLLGLLLWSAVAARAQDDATPQQQEEDAQQPDAAADQAQQATDPSAGVSQPEGGGERSAEVKTEPAAEEAPATPDAADTQPEDKQPEDAQPASGTEDKAQPAAADAKPAEATPEAAPAESAADASAEQEATPQADEGSKQLAQQMAVTTPEQLQAQVDAAIQMQVSGR